MSAQVSIVKRTSVGGDIPDAGVEERMNIFECIDNLSVPRKHRRRCCVRRAERDVDEITLGGRLDLCLIVEEYLWC